MDTMHEAIIGKFMETDSVKATAEALQLSVITVRRHLITAELWRSNTSDAVGRLYAEGKSVSEIANELCMSEKNVHSYLPYSKGSYQKSEKSDDAVWSKNYRERMRLAKSQQVEGAGETQAGLRVMYVPSHTVAPQLKGEAASVLHLKLELDLSGLDSEEQGVLMKYAKVDRSISRDILVSSDMTLHALHYALQKAFGWQNTHPHNFSLPEATFLSLTGNSFNQWADLCGIYFRFPSEDSSDLYWDDDYDGTVSVKSWLHSKFIGPYSTKGASSELCLNCQKAIAELRSHFPTIVVTDPMSQNAASAKRVRLSEATMDDVANAFVLEGNPAELLERLTLGDLLSASTTASSSGLIDNEAPVTDTIDYYYDYGSDWHVIITFVGQVEDESYSEVLSDDRPLCISHDGLPVMDDLLGVSGFCRFLQDIQTEDPKALALREWARQQGWTGRDSKSELIL